MPNSSGEDAVTPIVAVNPACENSSTDYPALGDLSERDKPWDKHRSNADKVANHYRGDEDFSKYADVHTSTYTDVQTPKSKKHHAITARGGGLPPLDSPAPVFRHCVNLNSRSTQNISHTIGEPLR